MDFRHQLEEKLRNNFDPEALEVIDESSQHAGHSGARPGGETHFRVIMKASKLKGLSRVDQQRRIHTLLREELKEKIHALALEISV